MVHAPPVLAGKVLAEVAAGQRGVGAELRIARRIGVVVLDAEQAGVDRLAGEAERRDVQDGVGGHGAAPVHRAMAARLVARWKNQAALRGLVANPTPNASNTAKVVLRVGLPFSLSDR